jgi:predicted transcriptional regulator
MKDAARQGHSRRERQIMDVIYRHGRATVAQVLAALPDPPSYSSVRAMLKILEIKGLLKHKKEDSGRGVRYIYFPMHSRRAAAQSALQRLLQTFFDGSAELAIAALIDASDGALSNDELDRVARLIEKARKDGR